MPDNNVMQESSSTIYLIFPLWHLTAWKFVLSEGGFYELTIWPDSFWLTPANQVHSSLWVSFLVLTIKNFKFMFLDQNYIYSSMNGGGTGNCPVDQTFLHTCALLHILHRCTVRKLQTKWTLHYMLHWTLDCTAQYVTLMHSTLKSTVCYTELLTELHSTLHWCTQH